MIINANKFTDPKIDISEKYKLALLSVRAQLRTIITSRL